MGIELSHIYKTYSGDVGKRYPVLQDLNFSMQSGEMVAIVGKSGAGKSTLLRILGLLETVDKGSYMLGGSDVIKQKKQWNKLRNQKIGFVMQDYALIDKLSVYDNIAAPMYISHTPYKKIENRVAGLVERFGIGELLEKKVCQLSGGEAQRVAIARAIVQQPELLLADEPTGALNSKSAQLLLETMAKMNQQLEATILMVTHDAFSASYAQRILFLKDGNLFKELNGQGKSRREFYNEILNVLVLLGGETNGAY